MFNLVERADGGENATRTSDQQNRGKPLPLYTIFRATGKILKLRAMIMR